MYFTELNLNKTILKALTEEGYTTPTPIQQKTIPLVLENKDVIASAQTGTGKTAAFALPIIEKLIWKQNAPKKSKKIKALIVSPTRELALQIQNNFKTYAKYTNLRSTVIFGGTSIEPQQDILKKGVDILIATPGRLLDLHKRELLNLTKVRTLVLDEADLMLDMGFIDDVKKIARLCPKDKQTLLFSATMPDKIVKLANTLLNNPEKVEVSITSSAAKNVIQTLYYVPKPKKMELCLHLLRNTIKGNILIFRRTKFGVDKLEKTLERNNYKVATIHGDKTQSARQTALNKFKHGEVNILIATDVASRGIDIEGLDAVINFDLPNISETYIHRIGRTARAGKKGNSYSFCGADELNYIKDIQQLINEEIKVITDHPYPLDKNTKPIVHNTAKKKSANTISGKKKSRKSANSKKNKKRWY
ncbi:DEAD/DEAH box helicase [Urechidicola croceus]|uniref:DEAD-box ATP-dependent RNA helicase RhpA n=1 Tax=Urechidicola croceus TaxID=1850246 RepID=A0A1D8P3M7_9FLAO|nr:DEAD/DEAH box helicase [Urechidicola croceus]AOW19198.1 RNA helicase [Urechidicola croceus]